MNSWKKSRLMAIIFIGLATLVVTFQNCGKQASKWQETSSQDEQDDSSTDTDTTPEEPQPAEIAVFNSGDLFNYSKVSKPSIMVSTQLSVLGYSTYEHAKAVAINSSGLGFVSIKSSGDEEEAKTTALEGCYALGGGDPCMLLAVGDQFVVGSQDLTASPSKFSYVLNKAANLDTEAPFLLLDKREVAMNTYKAATAPKAFAISVDGAYNIISHTTQNPIGSLAEAKRIAMERCELKAAITPCTLFAANDELLMNPANINRVPVIDYGRKTLGANIPGMRAAPFKQFVTDSYLPNVPPSTGSIWITRDGSGGMAYRPTGTDASIPAQTTCKTYETNGVSCFLYATNRNVTSLVSQLAAINKYSIETHCKIVPRASCSEHKAMGCNGGWSYVITQGKPTLTACP